MLGLRVIMSVYYVMNCDKDRLGASQKGAEELGRKSGLQTTGYLRCTVYSVCLLPLTSPCSSPEILYLSRHSAKKKIWQHETLFAFLCMLNKNTDVYDMDK